MNITPVQKSIYNEDITMAGESIIGAPCVIWDITVSCDVVAATVIKFFDATSATNCIEKVVLTTATPTVHLCYPKGKVFGTGVYATSSTSATANVSIDYD